MSQEYYHPGLRGVIAGETEICSLDNGLRYRGYCVYDLVQGASFLEVAYLLLHEQLPDEERFADFVGLMSDEATLPEELPRLFDLLPLNASPLEMLRSGINFLAHFDPQPGDSLVDAGAAQAIRLWARLPLLLGLIGGPAASEIPSRSASTNGASESLPKPRRLKFDSSSSYASNIYRLLTGSPPSEIQEHALEIALILSAEHEFTPSSYAARLAASTQADIYSAVQAALSTFIGARHSGAERSVLEVFDEVEDAEHATDWVAQKVAAQERIPGFGHPVFTDCDPRAAILEPWCGRMAAARGRAQREEIADAIEQAVWEQQRLPPNIDWPLGRLLDDLGLRRDLHPAIFATSRVVGWCAHALEQSQSGLAIRPRARYRGVEQARFSPLWKRVT
jgi:citrate synthase